MAKDTYPNCHFDLHVLNARVSPVKHHGALVENAIVGDGLDESTLTTTNVPS